MAHGFWTLPEERDGVAAAPELIEARQRLEGLARIQIACPEIEVRQVVLGGVPCLDIGSPDDPGLLYAHGGGFRMGRAAVWSGLASRFSQAGALRVVLPEYRLAPEHPFPAGLRDLCAVYQALTDQGGVRFVGGDSAGGGLACSLVISAVSVGAPLPAGVVLLSPWLDLTLGSPTFETNESTDLMFSRATAEEAVAAYLQGVPATESLASPGHDRSVVFPPTLIVASASETLLGDALDFARTQAGLGGEVELIVKSGQAHVWPMMSPAAPETQHVISAVAAFAGRLLS